MVHIAHVILTFQLWRQQPQASWIRVYDFDDEDDDGQTDALDIDALAPGCVG